MSQTYAKLQEKLYILFSTLTQDLKYNVLLQLKLMDLLKKTSEECRVQSHKHQLRSTELETSLEHCRQEVEQLRIQLEEAIHMRAVAQDQYKSLKKEKEELEELFAGGQGNLKLAIRY